MKLAVAQVDAAELDVAANVRRTVAAVAQAAAEGATLVVLPEMVASGYVLDADGLRAVAEPGDGSGPALSAWRAAAREHGTAIVGGFAELDGDRLFNAVAVIDRHGELVGRYRKLHLFAGEHGIFEPGDLGLPVFELDGVQVGVLVCYDLRFPEAMRLLALQGAEVVAAPAAWVTGFDKPRPAGDERIGQVEGALVQANLNQLYVACADQCGSARDLAFLGRSLVASPYGDPIVALGAEGEGVVVADVDPAEAAAARERGGNISPRANRRTDVYALALVDGAAAADGAEPDPEALLREIERRRGYVLDIHRSLARLDPSFLASYDQFLEATFLQQRLLDRRTKELVYIGTLIALDTPQSHLVTHMLAAVKYGATEREVLEVVEQVLAPCGVPRFISGMAAFELAFPDFASTTAVSTTAEPQEPRP